MKNLLFLPLLFLFLSSCEKVPVREDVKLKLYSVDEVIHDSDAEQFQVMVPQATSKIITYKYECPTPLKQFKVLVAYRLGEKDELIDMEDAFLVKPEIGSTTGVIQLKIEGDKHILGNVIQSKSAASLYVDVLDEVGSLASLRTSLVKPVE